MGAGGMIFVDPLFQRVLIDTVRSRDTEQRTPGDWRGLPVIFDEVFVGLYRLGFESATSILGVNPDISVNAKILTGGLVPLAITMASSSIFDAFYSDKKVDCLLHGHSYTAYPIGCEVANETLSLIDKLSGSEDWAAAKQRWNPESHNPRTLPATSTVWSFWDPGFVNHLSQLDMVDEVMTLGTVLSFKVSDNSSGEINNDHTIHRVSHADTTGYQSLSAQTILGSLKQAAADENGSSPMLGGAPYGINFRTLGNVAYFMLSLNTSPDIIRSTENRIWNVLNRK
jgi:bifunctional dethiobiotin synthetase / adenosylmethionine---8-amino-7-oxononanoate aminotransferase